MEKTCHTARDISGEASHPDGRASHSDGRASHSDGRPSHRDGEASDESVLQKQIGTN